MFISSDHYLRPFLLVLNLAACRVCLPQFPRRPPSLFIGSVTLADATWLLGQTSFWMDLCGVYICHFIRNPVVAWPSNAAAICRHRTPRSSALGRYIGLGHGSHASNPWADDSHALFSGPIRWPYYHLESHMRAFAGQSSYYFEPCR